jgi:hypothetical protein
VAPGDISDSEVVQLSYAAASTANDPSPTAIRWVRTTHEVAEKVMTGDDSSYDSSRPVVAIEITGAFSVTHPSPPTDSSIVSDPAGSEAADSTPSTQETTTSGSTLVLVLDSKTGDTLDGGVLVNSVDMSSLGPVSSAVS